MSSMVGTIGPGRPIRNAPNVTFCVGRDSRWVTLGSPLVSPGFAGDVEPIGAGARAASAAPRYAVLDGPLKAGAR
jgi:hypothetical protein